MSSAPIPRTKFLLIKAPASSLYEEKYGGDRNVFTVPMYAARMMAKKIHVGCVVDCTALDLEAFEPLPDTGKGTVRYFHDTLEWDDFDIDYKRLNPSMSGSAADAPLSSSPSSSAAAASDATPNSIPSKSTVDKFFSLCGSHWASRPGTYITLFDSRGGYGVAAYLCARYMCEKMRAPVHVALASLKEVAKPCGLADHTLIRDLQIRYKGRTEWKLENIPSWWWPVEDDDDEEEADDEDNNNSKKRAKPSENEFAVVIPPSGKLENGSGMLQGQGATPPEKKQKTSGPVEPIVPQLHQVAPDSPKYERAIAVVSQLTSCPCKESLPFPQEKRLLSADTLASALSHRKYKVTWRSKGRRGLLLILNEDVYFLEGNGSAPVAVSIVKSGMKFPVPTDLAKSQHRTLLDGVLVHDKEGGSLVPRYYASDILCHMGGILTTKPFAQRSKYLLDGVIMARKKDTRHDYSNEAIKIRAKEYFDVSRLEFVLNDVTRGVAHESNGVVFVPLEGKYQGGDDFFVWELNGNVPEQSLVHHVSSLS